MPLTPKVEAMKLGWVWARGRRRASSRLSVKVPSIPASRSQSANIGPTFSGSWPSHPPQVTSAFAIRFPSEPLRCFGLVLHHFLDRCQHIRRERGLVVERFQVVGQLLQL